MSTTQTITEAPSAQANALTLRSQSKEHDDDDTVSQESYSTVAGTVPPSGSGPDNQDSPSPGSSQVSKQIKNKPPGQEHDSDTDEEEPSPCGRCRKLVVRGDEAVQCEICSQWFHIK